MSFFTGISLLVLLATSTQAGAQAGFQIHDSCKTQFGEAEISRVVQDAMATGLSCMSALHAPASDVNVEKIKALLDNQEHPALLTCAETEGYDWSGAAAHGTIPGNPGHPQISINPELESAPPHRALQSTLFHEVFHNIGYQHEKDREFPYACQACCFSGMKARELGCKICRGNYVKGADREYLQDLVQFLGSNSIAFHARRVVFMYLVDHPRDLKARLLLIEAVKHEPGLQDVAYSLADSLRSRHGSELGLGERLQLFMLHSALSPPQRRTAIRSTAPLGEALSLILDGDKDSARRLLSEFKLPSSAELRNPALRNPELPTLRLEQLKADLDLFLKK